MRYFLFVLACFIWMGTAGCTLEQSSETATPTVEHVVVLPTATGEIGPEVSTTAADTPIEVISVTAEPALTATGTASPEVTATITPAPTATPVPSPTVALTTTPTTLPEESNLESTILFMAAESSDSEGKSVSGMGTIYSITLGSNGLPRQLSENNSLRWGRLFPAPNGSRVAVVWQAGVDQSILIFDVITRQAHPLFNGPSAGGLPGGVFYSWHPDSRQLLMWARHSSPDVGLWLVDSETEEHIGLRTKTPEIGSLLGGFGGAAISSDGQQVIYSRYDALDEEGIWMVNSDGSRPYRLTNDDGYAFAWSPDGQLIAFISPNGIAVMNRDGTNVRILSDSNVTFPFALLWSPDSHYLAFVTRESQEPVEDVVTPNIATEITSATNIPEPFLNTTIHLIDVITGEERPLLTDGTTGHIDPAWSPNGSQMAFASVRSGASEIWVVNTDGTNLRQLTNHSQFTRYPIWLPAATP